MVNNQYSSSVCYRTKDGDNGGRSWLTFWFNLVIIYFVFLKSGASMQTLNKSIWSIINIQVMFAIERRTEITGDETV